MIQPESIQLIVIDNPYDQMSDPLVQKLLPQLFDLKIKGYQSKYGYGVLPLDTNDFIATHFIISSQSGNAFLPLLSYKMITYRRAQLYNLPFAPVALMQRPQCERHLEVMQKLVAQSERLGQDVSYIGSLSMDPEISQEREFVQFLMNLFILIHFSYSMEFNLLTGLSGATVRFKTSRLIERIGYKPLVNDGLPLPPVQIPSVKNDLSQFFQLREFTDEARLISETYHHYWENVLFLGDRNETQLIKQAA